MCGIFGFVGEKQNVSTLMHERLKQLEYRGYDSWGIAASQEGKLWSMKQTGKIGLRPPEPVYASLAIGHTRWATTGPVTRVNAHPHHDCAGNLAVVHNGIVENYVALREELLGAGHRFLSDTDTEVIAHLIEEELRAEELPLAEALRRTAKKLKGLNAIAVMNTATGELAATKSGSPLYAAVGARGAYLSSDLLALSSLAEEVLRLKEGEVVELSESSLRLSSIDDDDTIEPVLEPLPEGFQDSSLGSYEHFLEKEIVEQADLLARYAAEKSDKVQTLRDAVSCAPAVVLSGCGSAYHAAVMGSYLAASRARTSVRVLYPHELEHFEATLRPNDLLLTLSQSGETIDVLDAIRLARKKSMNTAALVNVPTSTLAAEVDLACPLDAGPEISVLSTKAFLAMLARLASLFSPTLEFTSAACAEAKAAVETILEPQYRRQIKALAKELSSAKSMFVVGSGICYPLALEAALKVKEVSYIHAEGFASAELKHGVISLVEKDTPCVVFLPPGVNATRARLSAEELKARGAKLIGVGPEDALFDHSFRIDAENELSYLLAAIVPLQLLAYELALAKRLDPDKPRNLAKSVTVR